MDFKKTSFKKEIHSFFAPPLSSEIAWVAPLPRHVMKSQFAWTGWGKTLWGIGTCGRQLLEMGCVD